MPSYFMKDWNKIATSWGKKPWKQQRKYWNGRFGASIIWKFSMKKEIKNSNVREMKPKVVFPHLMDMVSLAGTRNAQIIVQKINQYLVWGKIFS